MAPVALEFVLLAGAVLGVAWGSVLVHEAGHYLAGWGLAVPRSDMRVRLQRPPHLALRRGQRWLSPDDPGYASTFARHNPSAAAAWLFVAGGFLFETTVVLLLAVAFRDIGTLPLVLVGASTVILLLYLIADISLSLRRSVPYGDAGAMWTISRAPTGLVLGAVLVARGGAVALLVQP